MFNVVNEKVMLFYIIAWNISLIETDRKRKADGIWRTPIEENLTFIHEVSTKRVMGPAEAWMNVVRSLDRTTDPEGHFFSTPVQEACREEVPLP